MAASYLFTLRNRVRPAGASTSARALGLLLALAFAPSAWSAKPAKPAAAAAASPAAKAAPAGGKDACQTGRSQYAGGDVLRAIASLERCVDKEPRNREGWAALATARLEAGRFSEAADAYGKAHALRPGDATFLVSYLDALEGSGRAVERVAVLRALSETRRDDGRHTERLLALIDSLGPSKHPEDRLFALEKLSQGPDAEIRYQEKLASAYLERGMREKAQAEYRGLLSRKPEVGEYWGGLAASIAKEDPAAALECYKKAIFFSNQAANRAAYEKEVSALKAGQDKVASAQAGEDKLAVVKAAEDKASREKAAKEGKEKQEKLAKAKAAEEKAAQEKAAKEEKERQEKLAKAKAAEDKAAQEKLAQEKAAQEKASREEKERQDKLAKVKAAEEKAAQEKAAKEEKEKQERLAKEKAAQEKLAQEKAAQEKAAQDKAAQERLAQEKAAQDKAAKEKTAAAAPAKPFDIKAFQDSIFKAELEKRLAVLKKPEAGSAKPGAVTPPSASPGLSKEEQEKKAKAEREEKEKQEKLAKEEKAKQEKLAKEEKEKQEKLAKEAAKKAEEDRKAQEKLAKEEKEKQEKLAKEAAKKAEEERKLKEKLAKEEKEKQDRLAKEAAKKVEEERKHREKLAKDSTAKAEAERLAKEKAAKELRDRFVKDSLAQAEKERLAKAEAEKKLKAEEEKARKQKEERERFVKDSVAKVEKERLARLEAERKAKEERDRFVKDSVAKVEKERLARLEAERKAKEARDRFVKDSLHKVEQERLARVEAERKAREAREKFLKDSLLAKLEADRKVREAREKFVKDSLAKVEQERLARLEAERKAREAREKFVKDSLFKVAEAERKVREARERFVRDSLAKVEKERLARLEAERKAREKQERHDRAIAFYKSGQLDSADALFKVVLGETPSPDAHYFAGRVHLDKGRADKALELLLKAPKDKPDMDGLLGRAYLKTGKKKEALESLERHFAKTSDPNVLEDICALRKPASDQGPWAACMEKLAEKRPMVGKYQEELAVHYRKTGDKAKSLERYSKLLVLEPAHGEANYQLGMDWGSQGVHDRAVPCLEKAVAAFPERSEAWKLLAKGQAATGRRAEAWKSYAKAASLLPKDIDVARGRLALAKDPGREADLPAAYLGVLKLSPSDGDANMGYARLRYQAKDYPAAEKHFRAGIGESREAAAWGQYGRSLLETRKLDEAAVALQKALDLGETSIALKLDLARLHLDKGDADKAEVLVKQISAKIPADPEPYFWLSKIAEKRQQAAVQEEFLRKANQLKPDEVRYAETLARLFKERDEFKQAIGVLSPNTARLSSEGRMLLADCLAATGEGQRALDIYTELFRKEPGPGVLARRIDALVRMGRAGEAVEAARGTAFADKPEVQYSVAKAHLALSESHVIKGDLDLAVSLMKKALDSDGHRPEFHYYLGRAYHMKGKLGKAHDAYTDALRYRVEYPDAVYWKGVAMVDDGKPLEARNYFEELSQHADLRWKARGLKGMARVFEAEGKWEAVEHHLQRSIATLPTADAMAYLSRVYLKLGRFPEAEDWARKALALDANHEGGTLALAEALAARKKIPEALGLASAALRVMPLSCDLLVQSARLNLEAGRLDSTLTTTGKAIEVCPTEPLPHFYAGMAMRGNNKPEDAKRHFKSFKKLGGDKKMLPE